LITGARADAELLARFRREALLGVRLGAHPKIAAVYDLGTWPDTGELYCAVELAPGRSLRALLADGPLPPREAVDLVAQIARAAAHAHTQGVVHRDLKPANVMVSDAGEVCLLDFGIAKALQDGTGLTLTGHFLGTPGYMAPEQVDDSKRVTPAADVYALGAILEHALSGETPSAQLGWRECFLQMLSGARERPSLGAPFDEIVARAEHLEPSQRPSATELASELEAWRPEHASD
jgi:serine/threonine protein kinase